MSSNSENTQYHPLWALFYENEGFSISGSRIMGRQAAGHSYLKAVVNSDISSIGLYLRNNQQKDLAKNDIQSLLNSDKSINVTNIPYNQPFLSEPFGGIFYPGPNISKYSEIRYHHGHSRYSLVGITHTTASHQVMTGLKELVYYPIMPWDSIICTSEAVLNTVNRITEQAYEDAKLTLGANKLTLPQLPVIPLGVHNNEFEFSDSFKIKSRESMGISKDDIVIIYVGRLSFHAKAHPLPMYLALEKCAKTLQNDKKIHLIQTGWFANDQIKQAFENEANIFCPNVKCHFLDGKDQELKAKTFACGDIFMSLSDNYQETFGLTPLEGMAAGLPVIVSDWNGYRSTVRNNIDGFTIPSYALQAGLGEGLAYEHMVGLIDYDNYIGMLSQKVAIDVHKCSEKLEYLILNKEKRLEMGNNGKKRAQSLFDWEKIIDQYKDLASELNSIRDSFNSEDKLNYQNLPSDKMDPLEIFASYPTSVLSKNTLIKKDDNINNKGINEIFNLTSVSYATKSLPAIEKFELLSNYLSSDKFVSIDEISNSLDISIDEVYQIVIVMLKYCLLKIQEDVENE